MQQKPRLYLSLIALAAILASSAAVSCSARPAPAKPDPSIVEAHSAGLIPRKESIQVVFTRPRRVELDPASMAALIRFEPPLKGRASWLDERTLQFKSESGMRGAQVYRAIVDYGILSGKPRGKDRFSFQFQAQAPALSVEVEPVSVDESGRVELTGTVISGEDEDDSRIERLLSPLSGGSVAAAYSWKHEAGKHRFTVSGISQGATERSLVLAWNGRPIGSSMKGKAVVRVPGARSFELSGLAAPRPGRGYVELAFSRALDRSQDLRGIVSIDGIPDLRYSVDRNKLKLYPAAYGLPSEATVRVGEGLRDHGGAALDAALVQTVRAARELPQARFLGSGVIVPTSQGFTVPIETMNLRGVIVEAFKINGSSIPQFLQVNDLDGKRELKRVGKPVWSKSFDLSFDSAMNDTWVRHGLDLSELIKDNPNGMFQIRVAFRKRHVEYQCPNDHPDFSSLPFPDDAIHDGDEGESSYWDFWDDADSYSWDSPYNYYNNRNDPCHPAFYQGVYGNDRVARRNVLVSDIGLMAKLDSGGAMRIYASDLRSAKPLAGVSLELLDYQRQRLAAAKTDSGGMAGFDSVPGSPSLVTASFSGQSGYLKLDEQSALKVSNFDVDGEKSEQGVKGFIYGERGVWRPGDPIFLTFILQDAAKAIPENHPVVFELENPRGQITSRETYTKGLNGFYAISAKTSPDAPTGDWTARVRVGNKSYAKGLKIETVMPNRLKIGLDLGKPDYLSSDTRRVSLSSAWLHGAPAPGLKADVSVAFSAAATNFPGYSDYVFEDPTRVVAGERQTLFEGVLDGNSKATFPVSLWAEGNPPGKLKANILSRVYEPSGVFSSEQFQVDYHPYARYVGLKAPKGDEARGMLLTDVDHSVELAMLDRDGKPVASASVECSVAKIQWRWWWEKGTENLAEYQNSEYYKVIQEGKADIRNGRGKWSFKVKYPEWGRYIITVRDSSGKHSAAKVVYIDWPGWAGRGGKDSGSASMLSLTVPKASYTVGETVSASFPSNDSGMALVVLEKSGRMLRQEWVKTGPETTRYDFKATEDMTPNVYLHVTFLQPHLQTANDLPIRLYGVAPVMVEDPLTHLRPAIGLPAELKPMSSAEFTVREESGRPMTYTVAVVDEGLLGLTRFKAPDPWEAFYRKEASLLKNWDLYQYVSGAFSGKLETLLSIGGSDDAAAGANRKANRFKAVTRYLGPFALAKGETKTHRVDIPEYVGALRFMVVAGSGAAYGAAEKSVPVKGDLMVLGTLPRVLSPGEEISFPVTVFSYASGRNAVQLSVSASGAASLAGSGTASISFPEPGEKIANFKVKAGQAPGPAAFRIEASTGSAKAAEDIELDVRSTALPVSVFKAGMVEGKPGKELTLDMSSLPGVPGSNGLTLELSRMPSLNLSSRLDWLITYPHGCVEQTTSSVFPQLYLDRVLDLSDEKKASIAKNVNAGIERLKSFQTPDGGFSYWPGSEDANAWGSNYAGHFLLEARRAGYDVPQAMLADWAAFQKNRAQAFSGETQEALSTQAYRLYDLALYKEADLASMNRLRERAALPLAASWRLAAAYYLSGERNAAQDMVKGLGYAPPAYRELSGTFGSDTRDLAMILETMNLLGDASRGGQVMRTLAEKVGAGGWMSTQELAYALIAILPYAGGGQRQAISYSYRLSLGKETAGPLVRGNFDSSLVQIKLDPGAASSAKIQLSTDSKAPVYARLIATGIPAMGTEKRLSSGLSLLAEYAEIGSGPIDPDEAPLGSDIEIQVTVTNDYHADLKQLALSHILPAGWEILNYRIAMQDAEAAAGEGGYDDAAAEEDGEPDGESVAVSPPGKSSPYPFMDYQDVRDDRVYTYFSLAKGETKTFTVRANKAYEGRFYLPAISVSAMYDQSIQALEPGRWLNAAAR